jgi:tRNA (adenine57-N1/adenine58-N1)-methyltransferase
MLDVHPGCKVVESGTGSGCMTLALARAVNPSGHVYSYEFNAVRAQKAQEEFNKLRVGDLISVTCRDVCGKYSTEQGGFSGLDDNSIDAIFLDLPEPWLALDHAHKILKPGKGICCYSPCIEQVMQTLQKLRALNFHSIKMIEVRQRPMDGR